MAGAPAIAREYLDAGALFVAVGVDTTLLVKAAVTLAREFKPTALPPARGSGS